MFDLRTATSDRTVTMQRLLGAKEKPHPELELGLTLETFHRPEIPDSELVPVLVEGEKYIRLGEETLLNLPYLRVP